jgi:RNA polymerase sigma-70 factor (ECF subfamily)
MADSDDSRLDRLVRAAQEGDPVKRDELFYQCRDYLRVVARAQVETWLQAKVDPSDLVQQTLLEAHRDFVRFEGRTGGQWLAWLRRILSHNSADFVRHYRGTAKRQARREVPLRSGGDSSEFRPGIEPAASVESPSQQMMRKDGQVQLAAAMAHLTADHREVIMLRNLQRLPFDEVAQRMGRSRPAVQMLWMRAIQKLQTLIDEA